MPPRKKIGIKRKRKPKSSKKWPAYKIHLVVYVCLILAFALFHYRAGISLFLQSVYERLFSDEKDKTETLTVNDIRNVEVFKKHNEMLFGFDVSHYQYDIEWHVIDSVYQHFPLDFVFIRATMGGENFDQKFKYNWAKSKSRLLVRGAYHYYRPDENSVQQAENFIRNVHLEPGDMAPVLDIEELPKGQSIDSLKSGLRKWLVMVEKHYKTKPIIYSGEHFYNKHLKDDFSDYPVWIANYNFFVEEIKGNWTFWQFSDKGTIRGIPSKVDLNVFQGTRYDLKEYLVQ